MHTQNGLADGYEDIGNAHQSSSFCLGARSIACSYAYSSEVHCHPILFYATASDWVRVKHLVLTRFWDVLFMCLLRRHSVLRWILNDE